MVEYHQRCSNSAKYLNTNIPTGCFRHVRLVGSSGPKRTRTLRTNTGRRRFYERATSNNIGKLCSLRRPSRRKKATPARSRCPQVYAKSPTQRPPTYIEPRPLTLFLPRSLFPSRQPPHPIPPSPTTPHTVRT